MQVNCAKCGRSIALTDVIESSAGRLSHLDCARAEGLTPEERALLFLYCSDHVVTKCIPCGLEFHMMQLAADPLGGRTNLCPRCRTDLTASVRAHLFGCAILPEEIRLRTQEARDAARMLVKRSQEPARSDAVLEAEVVLVARQQALRAAMAKRSPTS
jgi:DNA-directed RNA polymerase subunit RPC12/RpoP